MKPEGGVADCVLPTEMPVTPVRGALFVVFGHAHVPLNDGVYLNTGSFGFPAADGMRVFVEVDRHGARHRQMHPGGALVESGNEHRPRGRSALYAYAQKRLGRTHRPQRKHSLIK